MSPKRRPSVLEALTRVRKRIKKRKTRSVEAAGQPGQLGEGTQQPHSSYPEDDEVGTGAPEGVELEFHDPDLDGEGTPDGDVVEVRDDDAGVELAPPATVVDEVEHAPSDTGAPRSRPARPWETELVEWPLQRDGGVVVPGDGTIVETVLRPRHPRDGLETIQYMADRAEDARLAAEARRRAIEEDELAERELDRQTAMFRGQQLQPATGGDGFRRETLARNAVMASGLDMHATHQEPVPQDQLAAELQECFEEPLEAPSKYGDLPVYTVGQLVAGPYPMVPGWCVGDDTLAYLQKHGNKPEVFQQIRFNVRLPDKTHGDKLYRMRVDTRFRTVDGVYYYFSSSHLVLWTSGLDLGSLPGHLKELPEDIKDAFAEALDSFEAQGGTLALPIKMYQVPLEASAGYERRGPHTLVRVPQPPLRVPEQPSSPAVEPVRSLPVAPVAPVAPVPQGAPVPRAPSNPAESVDVALADIEAEEARLRAQKVRLLASRGELSRQSVPVPTPVLTPVALPPGFGAPAEVGKGVGQNPGNESGQSKRKSREAPVPAFPALSLPPLEMGNGPVLGGREKPKTLLPRFPNGDITVDQLESFVTSAKFYFDRFPMNPRELVRDMYMLVQNNPTFANPTATMISQWEKEGKVPTFLQVVAMWYDLMGAEPLWVTARNEFYKCRFVGGKIGPYIAKIRQLVSKMWEKPMSDTDQVREFKRSIKVSKLSEDILVDPATLQEFETLDALLSYINCKWAQFDFPQQGGGGSGGGGGGGGVPRGGKGGRGRGGGRGKKPRHQGGWLKRRSSIGGNARNARRGQQEAPQPPPRAEQPIPRQGAQGAQDGEACWTCGQRGHKSRDCPQGGRGGRGGRGGDGRGGGRGGGFGRGRGGGRGGRGGR